MRGKRIPKQAYFAYRDALAPLLVSLRTDRFAYTAGETIQIEAFLCNDTAKSGAYTLAFELYNEQNKLIQTGRIPAHADACRAVYVASAEFPGRDRARPRNADAPRRPAGRERGRCQ